MAGKVQMYYGEGRGKSSSAIGWAIQNAALGKETVIIQFLKGRNETEKNFFAKLEPEIKFFTFSKSDSTYDELDEAGRIEELIALKNGFNYSKKVVSTGTCDLIVLDEILGLVDEHIITVDDIIELIKVKPDDVTIICTGRGLDDRIRPYADEIYCIAPEKCSPVH